MMIQKFLHNDVIQAGRMDHLNLGSYSAKNYMKLNVNECLLEAKNLYLPFDTCVIR